MKIYICDTRNLKYDFLTLYNSLDSSLKDEVDSFKGELDRLRALISRSLVKNFTPNVNIRFNEFNKPYKDGLFYNVSHSKDLVVLITDENNEVGIDTESLYREIKPGLSKYVFNKEFDSALEFYTAWTKKEAISKCLGFGITKDLHNIPYNEGLNVYNSINIYATTINIGEYIISFAVKNEEIKDFELVIVEEL
ncbi:MAG: hypothetical protein K6G38_01085 [Gammaproteobacteria bacterium]|nr:hypothetical protein [Gammaproteobacteria bacterium]